MTSHRGVTTIGNSALRAGFLVDQGMLGVSLKHDGRELVAMPNSVDVYCAGKLTGIPLMHPWANRLRSHRYTVGIRTIDLPPSVPADGNGLPMHGTLHGKTFTTTAHTADKLEAAFEFTDSALLESFPFPHRIAVRAEVETIETSHSLTITTTVTNLGAAAMPISFGWHPYLIASTAPRNIWRVRIPRCLRHGLDELLLPTGHVTSFPEYNRQLGATTFDDHFTLGDDRNFAISTDDTTIGISFNDGYTHAQIYVPPDLGDGHQNFVCIEPMTARSNALGDGLAPMLDASATFAAAFTITVT